MSTKITEKIISDHGISPDEYKKVLSILGREPNFVELGIFSVMWSEHCSYKSSRKFLSQFPTKGPLVIHGPGENAGVVDIGDGYAAVFKMESHNHPSFIEPYEGAATGVGGILRDVFTMGARPIALLNSLRFGSTTHPKTKFLVNGVVSGIAGYGNCVGVPTIGGEVHFNASYDGNILVNVFCLGLARIDKIFTGKAAGVGNPVLYVGSKTGRDGIHGATMASSEFDDATEEQRPTVQVGDPFTEKLLIEACLEAMKTDSIVGIQDMGAAGLTSSSCEMAGRAGNGIEIDVGKVPRREEGITPYEILLSESQERMLIVAKQGEEERLQNIFIKWGLDAVTIGKVTDDGMFRVTENGKIEAEIPALAISENAPKYDRPSKEPAYFKELKKLNTDSINEPDDYNKTLYTLLTSMNLASKEWVFRQFDHMVRTNTIVMPGSDAAVVRIKGTTKGIAISVDCNARYCFLDPYNGAKIAVAESMRNVLCSGAKPIALTDNLNFGNPEKPEVMWQMKEAIRGITEACKAFDIQVVSGNVSLYNETKGKGIFPTPTLGMVGIVEDINCVTTQWFKGDGEAIFVLGENHGEIGGTEYLSAVHNMEKGEIPIIDFDVEKKLQLALLRCSEKTLLRSAHDCSEGGIAVALAEACISGPDKFGATIDISSTLSRDDFTLFGESQSRAIVTVLESNVQKLESICMDSGIPVTRIGTTCADELKIRINGTIIIKTDIVPLKAEWQNAFPSFMEQK